MLQLVSKKELTGRQSWQVSGLVRLKKDLGGQVDGELLCMVHGSKKMPEMIKLLWMFLG